MALPDASCAAAHPRLPDQVVINHGPRDLLATFFLQADRMARDRGVRLSISHDFDELTAVNCENRASWDALLPTIDPARHALTQETAFWLRGTDDDGRVVLTRGCRRLDLERSSLHDELTSLRLFYGRAGRGAAPEEFCVCTAQLAADVRGVISFQAGAWHDPRFRGKGLSAISARVVKALAYTTWAVDQWVSLVDDALAPKLIPAYGITQAEPGIEWRRYGESIHMHILRMTRAEFLDDLRAFTHGARAVSTAA